MRAITCAPSAGRKCSTQSTISLLRGTRGQLAVLPQLHNAFDEIGKSNLLEGPLSHLEMEYAFVIMLLHQNCFAMQPDRHCVYSQPLSCRTVHCQLRPPLNNAKIEVNGTTIEIVHFPFFCLNGRGDHQLLMIRAEPKIDSWLCYR